MRVLYSNFLLVLFFFSLICFSQENTAKDIRFRVQVKDLIADNAAFEEYLARITESVTTNLKQTNRVDVFGTKNEKAIDDVIAESMEQDASKWIWDTNEKMVKYTVTGSVNSIKLYTLSDNYYKSSINFTLVVTDNNTKDVIAQQEFVSEKKLKSQASRTPAFNQALKSTEKAQRKFFKSVFNLRTTILKFDDYNKKNVSSLTVTSGKTSGLKKNDELIVKHIEIIDGFQDETTVGILKVKEVGARTSKCQVSKGGKEILKLFDKKNRETLICELKKDKK
ncbi:MAG: hypothetical protein VXY26_01285 [Bacteroidota bacterium]|nr:hypothetical protein [Bacteroidota bacterium]